MATRFSYSREFMVGLLGSRLPPQSETYLALEIGFLLKFGATNLNFSSPITPLR
jgi:hypothetical protein